jgi:predicted phosphodiesterase
MKIQVLSDLHIEFMTFKMHHTDADVVVLAGDIHTGIKGVEWAMENIKQCPVIYVLGNHEYYGKSYPKLIGSIKNITRDTNVHLLENDSISVDNTLFVGCTLWTDFELFGDFSKASSSALLSMNDFKKIRNSPNYSKIRPIDLAIIHKKSLSFINQNINDYKHTKLVVVTHHAPSAESIPLEYKSDYLSPMFASNLDELILQSNIDLWIHGHIHHSLDYQIGSSRIICNPRGYPDEINHDFNPEMLIEV